jgi:hypothetical protein
MGTCSLALTDSPSVSSKRVMWNRFQLPFRLAHTKSSTFSSSSSSDTVTAPESRQPCTLPPPPRPPRPKTCLPNLRPTVILSPSALPAKVYMPSYGCSLKSPKTISFSDDVFAALPAGHGPHHADADPEVQDISSRNIWDEFTSDLLYPSSYPKLPRPAQIGHGYIQRQDENSGPSAIVHSPYASSSCLGTSLTSYCQEPKHLEFSSSTCANASRNPPDRDNPENEQNPGGYNLTALQVWFPRYRRFIWILGAIVFVLVASSAITGAIIWRLTTCKLSYYFELGYLRFSRAVSTCSNDFHMHANQLGYSSWLRSQVIDVSNVECVG